MAKLFVLSVRCPVCAHANDQDFCFCQRCGYKRKQLSVRPVNAVEADLDGIDKRFQQLTNFDRATSYSKQKDSFKKELENFLAALPGKPGISTVTPRDCAAFSFTKIDMGKRKYIVMVVVFWVSEVLIRVVVRLDFHIRRWTPILESYALFFMPMVGMASGIHDLV